jgi:hypothetical protein
MVVMICDSERSEESAFAVDRRPSTIDCLRSEESVLAVDRRP